MSKNTKITSLDVGQIIPRVYDESNDSYRMTIIGGADISVQVDTNALTSAITEGIKGIQFQSYSEPTKDIQIVEIPKQEFIVQKEIVINTIEIPQIIIQKEVEIKEIKVPKIIIQKEIEVLRVEVPVITTNVVTQKEDKYFKLFVIIQSIVTLGLLIKHLL